MTVRRSVRLADGRELIYFDDYPGADRSAPDRRELPASGGTPQVRLDPLFQDYSIIAGHRQTRTYRPATADCPLDPSGADRLTEIPAADYDVVVFENRFPSLVTFPIEESVLEATEFPFVAGPGIGRCEVICFTSDHNTSFSQLPVGRVATVMDAWIDRTAALSAIPGIEYVFAFENRGEEIGVTLSHPHGQIYGYPFVPIRFAKVAEAAAAHRLVTDSCLQCDIASHERHARERVVVDSEHFLVYVPFAARWPYEVRIVPHRHIGDLPGLSTAERADLAAVYLDVLRRFDRLFDSPAPYIAGWQQAPVHGSRENWHLAAEVFTIRRANDKLKYLAGSESGAAVWINDVLPEMAAARLRGD